MERLCDITSTVQGFGADSSRSTTDVEELLSYLFENGMVHT